MNEKQSCELLERHGIKPTANRIVIAKTLADSDRPLSLKELEENILSIDKSGIFRTITLFRAHHLVHVIDGVEGGVRYELCLASHENGDDDSHVHFYCEECRQTFCLNDIPLPEIQLPADYCVTSANYIVHGICPNCRRKGHHF
ncbi:MAG: Fur family transcriptional regulator [Prevotella sp.]|jgi:Fur family ferric uptake transcriptional regulator